MNEAYVEVVQSKVLTALVHLHQLGALTRDPERLAPAVAALEEANQLLGRLLGPDYGM